MSDADQLREHLLPLSGPGESAPEPPQIDGYEIIGLLGEGGMGAVWRARQLSTDRIVALKVMKERSLRSTDSARSRFEREVTLAARLEHPGIARVYESGIHKNKYFYAMELIEGEAPDAYAQRRALSSKAILELMHKVCLAVQHAHQHGVIHRDLKPSNILVTPDGQPHILDFGLARDLLMEDRDGRVSIDGDLIGTLPFMSPEQVTGRPDMVDTRSDVYSLGVILYRLLTGRFPYDVCGTTMETLQNITSVDPARPRRILRTLDTDVEAVLLKALAKDPAGRYPSAAELAEDIRRWLEGLPVSAKSLSTVYVLHKLIRRRALASTVIGLLLLICVAFSAAYLYVYIRWQEERLSLAVTTAELQRERQLTDQMNDQLTFVQMLNLWQKDRRAQVASISLLFPGESREERAARFLLDPNRLSEKAGSFAQNMAVEEPFFADIVLAEHYLHDGDQRMALDLFRRSLRYKNNKPDLILRFRAKDRIAELIAVEQPDAWQDALGAAPRSAESGQ
jgi:serine/threonine protein kinase